MLRQWWCTACPCISVLDDESWFIRYPLDKCIHLDHVEHRHLQLNQGISELVVCEVTIAVARPHPVLIRETKKKKRLTRKSCMYVNRPGLGIGMAWHDAPTRVMGYVHVHYTAAPWPGETRTRPVVLWMMDGGGRRVKTHVHVCGRRRVGATPTERRSDNVVEAQLVDKTCMDACIICVDASLGGC